MQSLSSSETDPSSCLLKSFLKFLGFFEPELVKIIEKIVESSFVCISYNQEHDRLFTFEEFDLSRQINVYKDEGDSYDF